MLLDTGADVSLLPRSHFQSLTLPDAQQYELEAFDGTRSTAPGHFRNYNSSANPFADSFC